MNSFLLFALIDALPVALVILINPLKGLARWVSPDTLVVLMLYAIFAVRPLFTDRFRSAARRGEGIYGLAPSLDGQISASFVGMVLLWAIAAGAVAHSHWRRGRMQSTLNRATADVAACGTLQARPKSGRAVLITIFSLVLFVAILTALKGFNYLSAMAGGRSNEASTEGVPEVLMVLPLAGSIAAAVTILTARNQKLRAVDWLAITFCTLASLYGVSQLGFRRLIIPAILIVVTALLMRAPTRVRVWHLAMGVAGLVALAVVPYVRAAGSRQAGENMLDAMIRAVSDFGAEGSGLNFFTSYDTEMYDYIALLSSEWDAGRIQLGWGKGTFVDFLARPFPAGLTPFPSTRSDDLTAHIYNYSCYQSATCDAPNPVLSVGGVLFLDWGFAGVLVGGIIVGFLVRAVADRWSRSAELTVSQNLMTAVVASHLMIAVRTDTMAALWWIIYAVIIARVVTAAMGVGMDPKKNGPRVVSTRTQGNRHQDVRALQ